MSDELTTTFDNADAFIEAASGLRVAYIQAADLGLSSGVWVRELSAGQRAEVMKRGGRVTVNDDGSTEIDLSGAKDAATLIASFCLVTDESGQDRIFKRSDDPRLAKISGRVLDVITKKARELSGMTRKSSEDLKKE